MTDEVDPIRRGLLSGRFLTRDGRRDLRAIREARGMLPPGLAPAATAGQCAQCAGYCVDACERRIVRRHEQAHARQGQPWLDLSRDGCTFCGACAQACPEVDGVRQERIGVASIDSSRCLAFTGVVCISCASRCGYQAIHRDHRSRPVLQSEACTGCGACIAPCPTNAITLSSLPDAE